ATPKPPSSGAGCPFPHRRKQHNIAGIGLAAAYACAAQAELVGVRRRASARHALVGEAGQGARAAALCVCIGIEPMKPGDDFRAVGRHTGAPLGYPCWRRFQWNYFSDFSLPASNGSLIATSDSPW